MNSRCKLVIYFGSVEQNGDGQTSSLTGVEIGLKKRDDWCLETDLAIKRAFRPVLDPKFYSVRFLSICDPDFCKFVAEIRILPDGSDKTVIFKCDFNRFSAIFTEKFRFINWKVPVRYFSSALKPCNLVL